MGYEVPEDYITVAERIVEFREKHPEGSLQPADLSRPYTIETINGNTCFVVVAAAYRHWEDARPGIGMAYEPVPGTTPFTRGSELQNAETAAWGRAIVAALAADTKKGVASKDELRLQQERQQPQRQQPRTQRSKGPADAPAAPDVWDTAIADCAGDFQKLGEVYLNAQKNNAPQEAIDKIRAAGEAARVAMHGGQQ